MTMGTAISFAIYVEDEGFVPTRPQLRGIASIFLDAGIVDAAAYKVLDESILAAYQDNTSPVKVKNTSPDEPDAIGYKIQQFPFFDSSNKTGRLEYQFIEVYSEPHAISPVDGVATRLVIASVDHGTNWDADWLDGVAEAMRADAWLTQLQARLVTLFKTEVLIETCFS